jgi:hypothetical protein
VPYASRQLIPGSGEQDDEFSRFYFGTSIYDDGALLFDFRFTTSHFTSGKSSDHFSSLIGHGLITALSLIDQNQVLAHIYTWGLRRAFNGLWVRSLFTVPQGYANIHRLTVSEQTVDSSYEEDRFTITISDSAL